MSFLKNKVVITLIIILAAVLALAGVAGLTGGSASPVAHAVRLVFSPVQRAVSAVGSSVSGAVGFVWEMHGYKEENERLVLEMNELRKENRSVADYKTENERLKELLDLKEQHPEFNTTAANVISYGTNNWGDYAEINRGTAVGLSLDSVVVTAAGVVGRITEIGPNWAKVSTIINSDHAVGAKVTRTGDVAIVEGDVLLAKDGYCKMSFLSKDASLVTGDILETSGLGGVYPAGLSIGKIREIMSDSSGAMQYAVVEPFCDFDNLHEVLVIK
jgi:rod shape-determining protein MreC